MFYGLNDQLLLLLRFFIEHLGDGRKKVIKENFNENSDVFVVSIKALKKARRGFNVGTHEILMKYFVGSKLLPNRAANRMRFSSFYWIINVNSKQQHCSIEKATRIIIVGNDRNLLLPCCGMNEMGQLESSIYYAKAAFNSAACFCSKMQKKGSRVQSEHPFHRT